MSRSTRSGLTIASVAETLAIAAIGGVALGLSGFPAGWLSGAILTVTGAALAGRPMALPGWVARILFVMIGISLGSVVTPELLRGMASYPLSIATLIAAMASVAVAGTTYLRAVHGWTMINSYLAAVPGALSQVMIVAAEIGADLQGIAIVQSIRVVIVAVGLPALLSLFGLAGEAVRRDNGPLTVALVDEFAILIAVSTACALVAHRFRLPGGLLFGAMIGSAVLHGSGMIHVVVPWWVANTAMVGLGAVIGSRFTNMALRQLLYYLGAGVGTFAVSAAVVTVFAAVLIPALSLPVPEVAIAFAPGSVDAMMLLALTLHLDPLYVGAHHISRIIFVSMSMPFIARHIARAPARAAEREPPRGRAPFQD